MDITICNLTNVLLGVCSSLSKIGSSESNFVIRFTPSKIHFIARDNQNASAFVYVDANILFDYYEIESLNRNEITMELSFARLERVLKLATSDSGRNEVTLRLSKNKETHRPLLSIRCKMFNIEGNELTVNHEFPCKIFHPDESVVNEPVMGKMLAYVLLPDVQLIRNIVDKLKGIDSKMLVSVSMRGCLGFQVKTDFVQVNIELDELERPEISKF